MGKDKEKNQVEKEMGVEISERYINPYLSNMARLLERPKALQDRIFTRLFEQAEVARFTPEERNEYVASKKEYWDSYSIVTTAYGKGHAEGLVEGEAKAEARARQEKLESARKLKALHLMSSVQIAEAIGLPVEEVDEL